MKTTWQMRWCFLLSWCYFSGLWRTINPRPVIVSTFEVIDQTFPAEWNAAAFEMRQIIGDHGGFTWLNYFLHLGTTAIAALYA